MNDSIARIIIHWASNTAWACVPKDLQSDRVDIFMQDDRIGFLLLKTDKTRQQLYAWATGSGVVQ